MAMRAVSQRLCRSGVTTAARLQCRQQHQQPTLFAGRTAITAAATRAAPRCIAAQLVACRHFSKERAGKGVRPGVAILVDGAPHRVSKITQGKRGKGGGFVRATVKNLLSGQVFEKTYTSDEMIEFADLEKELATFSWEDSDNYIFMSTQTFEEIPVPKVGSLRFRRRRPFPRLTC